MANSPRKANHERLEENLLMHIQFKHQDLHFPVRVFILSSNPVRFRLRLHLTANVPTLQDLFSRKHRFPFFAKVARDAYLCRRLTDAKLTPLSRGFKGTLSEAYHIMTCYLHVLARALT